jgi:hypothetical protein
LKEGLFCESQHEQTGATSGITVSESDSMLAGRSSRKDRAGAGYLAVFFQYAITLHASRQKMLFDVLS